MNVDERVVDVQFSDDAISVSLRDGRVISVPLVWYPRLLDATAAQRNNWKIAGGGYGIHWPDIDEDRKRTGFTVLTGGSVSAFVGGSEDGGNGRIDLVGVDVLGPGALDSLVEPREQLR